MEFSFYDFLILLDVIAGGRLYSSVYAPDDNEQAEIRKRDAGS
jgi:hypothetical protein